MKEIEFHARLQTDAFMQREGKVTYEVPFMHGILDFSYSSKGETSQVV